MTVLFVAAVVAWAAGGGMTLPADAGGAISHAMLGFQLLASGAVVLARRLSFASLVCVALVHSTAPRATARALLERDLAPPSLILRGFPRDAAYAALRARGTHAMMFAIDRRMQPDDSPTMMTGRAYAALAALADAWGVGRLPPLAALILRPERR